MQRIKEKGVKTLGIDYTVTTLTDKNAYKELGVKFKDISNRLEKIFSVKNKEEIKKIEKACEVAQKAFYETLEYITEGVTEKEIADRLEYAMKVNGAERKFFHQS